VLELTSAKGLELYPMKPTKTAVDVYEIVTGRMVALLEKGVIPWQKPWVAGPQSIPSNFVSKKPYRGVNVWLLLCSEFNAPYWLTYKQAGDLGGNVKKGEKGTPVVFWNWFPKKVDGKPVFKNGKAELVPFLKYYTVFNVEQTEGIKWEMPSKPIASEFTPNETADAIVGNYPNAPVIRHKGARACYSPALDIVTMPERESFKSPALYYSVLFHELTHSTGHTSRLARKEICDPINFGSDPYAREELCAEMGAAFLSAQSGFLHLTQDDSAAYLHGWLSKLKEDKKLVVTAAAQAQKACDMIMSGSVVAEEQEAETVAA
jgi:antirestriction protein ArdC